jgi:diacylglycerol O-acyltransferase
MQKHAELPEQSLKAMVPVSLRKPGDMDSANAVGSISVNLATNIADPVKRMIAIRDSASAGKEFFFQMSANEAQLYSMLMQAPGMLLVPLGLMSKMPPFNTIILMYLVFYSPCIGMVRAWKGLPQHRLLWMEWQSISPW